MKEGWVACDKDGTWSWSAWKMFIDSDKCRWINEDWKIVLCDYFTSAFNIAPAEDWKNSLIKIERK